MVYSSNHIQSQPNSLRNVCSLQDYKLYINNTSLITTSDKISVFISVEDQNYMYKLKSKFG